MSTNQGDFEPVAKRFSVDNPKHNRNWKALATFLRTNFVSNANLQDGSVDTVKIRDLTVTDAKITNLTVDKLTAGTLSADVLLASTIRTAETGQRVEIDANGIRLNDGSADVVNIPISGPATFTGGINATSLQSAGATLGGATQVDAGGSFVFSSGLADPGVSPTIAVVYDQTPLLNGPSAIRGIGWDGTDNQLLACGPAEYKMYGFDATTGARNWQWDLREFVGFGTEIDLQPRGITRLGSFIYVVSQDARRVSDKVYLAKYSLSGGAPDALVWQVTATDSPEFTNFGHLAGMTNDGSDVYVGFVKATGDVCVSRFDTSGSYVSTTTIDAGFETGSKKVYDVEYATIDGGKWWVMYDNSPSNVYRVAAYFAGSVPAEDFDLPGESKGVAFDGSVFITTPTSGNFYRKHSEWRGSHTVEHVKFAWYDSGGGYESIASAQAHTAFVQRAFLRVSWPAIPTGADSVRTYFLENNVNGDPGVGNMKRQGTETGLTTQTYDTYNSGGAADASSTSFPASTPAIFILPRSAANPGTPQEGQTYYNTTAHVARVYDGTNWKDLW